MFVRVTYLEDIEKLSGILVKNGYTVKRASIKTKGKSRKTIYGIEITENEDAPKEDDED
jgi:hypothetical protein